MSNQAERTDEYEKALVDLHETVRDEEEPEMKARMAQARRNWFTEELGKGRFPEDLKGFYEMLNVGCLACYKASPTSLTHCICTCFTRHQAQRSRPG